jgi:hypothetical protein
MVARNRIRCTLVVTPEAGDRLSSRGALDRDLLPWADPYVAGLIKKLQDEVRAERRERALVRHYRAKAADEARLEPKGHHSRAAGVNRLWSLEPTSEADPIWNEPWSDILTEPEPCGDDRVIELGDDWGDRSLDR